MEAASQPSTFQMETHILNLIFLKLNVFFETLFFIFQ